MKRFIGAVILGILVLLPICSALAAVHYATLEELEATAGPATVKVIAKTSEPSRTLGNYLTENTTWRWLIKDQSGEFSFSRLDVTMREYRDLNYDERRLVLNHTPCVLTIEINGRGVWHVVDVARVPKDSPVGNAVIIILSAAAIFGVVIYWDAVAKKGPQPAAAQSGSRQNSRPTAAPAAGGRTKPKPKPAPRFHVGDLVEIKYRGQYGHVIDVNGGMYLVRFADGKRVESYTADELNQA